MKKIETGISELLNRQPVTEQEKDAYIQDLQKALRLLLEQPHKISTITGTSKPVTTVRRRNSSKRLV